MTKDHLLQELRSSEEFFERSTRVLTEEHSNYVPAPGMMTVAQQVAHAGQSVRWFLQGVTRPEGFDMDFEKHERELRAITSLAAARQILTESYREARELVRNLGDEGLAKKLPEGQLMGGEPVGSVLLGIVDHSAHHRGALTVYSRLLGKTPLMPYMEMPAETPA